MKIGIVGVGVIGSAVMATAKLRGFESLPVDPALDHSYSFARMIAEEPDAIFVCLPTPSGPQGECNVSILSNTLAELAEIKLEIPVIVHSTAPWEFYRRWESVLPTLVYIPEFVTGKSAVEEYQKQKRVILGGSPFACKLAGPIVDQLIAPEIKEHCSIAEAAFVKYLANSYLALKVAYMNQMSELAQASSLSWNNISSIAQRDPRLGTSHWSVPGPDGKLGFGGACFPKDTTALLNQADYAGIGLSILETAVKYNNKLRR